MGVELTLVILPELLNELAELEWELLENDLNGTCESIIYVAGKYCYNQKEWIDTDKKKKKEQKIKECLDANKLLISN